MRGSCVQPAVSSILKRSIKKRLMVVGLSQGGEPGRVNSRAETWITGIEVSKGNVAGREPIVISRKVHLSFPVKIVQLFPSLGSAENSLGEDGLAHKGDRGSSFVNLQTQSFPVPSRVSACAAACTQAVLLEEEQKAGAGAVI